MERAVGGKGAGTMDTKRGLNLGLRWGFELKEGSFRKFGKGKETGGSRA